MVEFSKQITSHFLLFCEEVFTFSPIKYHYLRSCIFFTGNSYICCIGSFLIFSISLLCYVISSISTNVTSVYSLPLVSIIEQWFPWVFLWGIGFVHHFYSPNYNLFVCYLYTL